MKNVFLFLFLFSLLISMGGWGQQATVPITNRKTTDTYNALQSQLEIAKKHPENPAQIAQAYLQLGEYYHTLGLYTEAIAQYNSALELLGPDLDDPFYIVLNNNIGKVYLSLNNFELAEQYFEETKKASEQLKDDKGLAASLGLLGASHEKQSEYDEALQDQRRSLDLFQKQVMKLQFLTELLQKQKNGYLNTEAIKPTRPQKQLMVLILYLLA